MWAPRAPATCRGNDRLPLGAQPRVSPQSLAGSSICSRQCSRTRPCTQPQRQHVPPSCSSSSSSSSSRSTPRRRVRTAAMAPAAPPPPAAAPTTVAATAAAEASPPAATAAAGPADPCLDLHGIQARAVGSLVAGMCGNALGAQVEPEKHYRLARLFPDGLQDMSWSYDLSPRPLPAGHVTGDFVTMLAVAWSLARKQQADPFDMLDCLVSSYDPYSMARYSPYTALALEGLASGTNPFLLAKHVEGFMAVTPSRTSQSCSHRPDRQLHGTADFTGVIRAIPIGIAYREAPQEVLRGAVDAAMQFTHPTEQGSEGAVVIAAAVAWLLKADPATETAERLLEHLLTVAAGSQDMTAKLQLLQQRLPALHDVGLISSWRQFWASASWAHITNTANLLTKSNLAVQGTQAAALALWVVCVSWRHPKQAVMLAACLGGFAATTGALVGAMMGALHGCEWVPQEWWGRLQDEHQQQQQEEEESEEGEAAAAAAEAVQASGEDTEADNPLSVLRVGKCAVVVLGNELAAVSARRNPPLFG